MQEAPSAPCRDTGHRDVLQAAILPTGKAPAAGITHGRATPVTPRAAGSRYQTPPCSSTALRTAGSAGPAAIYSAQRSAALKPA